jgi:hypothetical protein
MDQLNPGRPLVSMDRDRTPEVEAHREGRTPGDRATVDPGNADRARRTDQSTVEAVCSSAAKHNRAHRNAKLAGSLRVAQHRPLEGLALEGHTGSPLPAAAEMVRRDTAGRPLGLER